MKKTVIIAALAVLVPIIGNAQGRNVPCRTLYDRGSNMMPVERDRCAANLNSPDVWQFYLEAASCRTLQGDFRWHTGQVERQVYEVERQNPDFDESALPRLNLNPKADSHRTLRDFIADIIPGRCNQQ